MGAACQFCTASFSLHQASPADRALQQLFVTATLQQLVLYVLNLVVMAALLPQDQLKLVPILVTIFIFGRWGSNKILHTCKVCLVVTACDLIQTSKMVKEKPIQRIPATVVHCSPATHFVDDSIKEYWTFWSGASPSSMFMDYKCPNKVFYVSSKGFGDISVPPLATSAAKNKYGGCY